MNKTYQMLGYVIVVTGSLVLAGCQAHTKQAGTTRAVNKHIQLGNELYDQGRDKDAMREWEVALALKPDQPKLKQRIQAVEAGQTIDVHAPLTIVNPNISSGAQERVTQELQKADQFYQQSQLKEAEHTWEMVLQLDSENQVAQSGLQKVNAERYQTDPDRGFDNLIKENYEKGMMFYRKKEWQSAETHLANAANLAAGQAQVDKYLREVRAKLTQQQDKANVAQLRQQAQEAQSNQDWVQVKQVWQKIQSIEPEAQDAKDGIALAQKELDQMAVALVKKGDTAFQAKQQARAGKLYRKALQYNPKNSQAKKGLTKVKKTQSQGKARKTSKNKAKKYFEDGAAFYKAGQIRKAISQWKQAVVIDPENAEYQKWLTRAQTEQEKQAAKDYQISKTRYNDGLQAFQREDLEEATAAFQDVIDMSPDSSEASKAKKHIAKIKKLLK
jgi:tetratricopeptide (TPR) repeat protein